MIIQSLNKTEVILYIEDVNKSVTSSRGQQFMTYKWREKIAKGT